MSKNSGITGTQHYVFDQPLRKPQLIGSSLKLFFVIVIAIGIFFRFVNIDRKVYWHDETLTSLRTFGHTKSELIEEAFDGELMTIAELSQYQQPSPDKTLGDTVHALLGNAEHPPLYYLMARLWAVFFGASVTAMRALPAITSLLAFPCIYWLCWELFESPLVGWLAMALVAVSPFHVLYAQEAREYSLWVITVLISSAAVLRASRLNTKGSWLVYAATAALGFYSHAMAILVSISHGIYVWFNKRFYQAKVFRAYLLASAGGILAFFPWLLAILLTISVIYETTAGSRRPASFSRLIDWWFLNSNRIFFDYELAAFNIIFVLLVIYVLYFLCRRTPQRVWSFALILAGVTALTLMVPDIIWGGRRSSIMRYVVPCIISIQLATAYFLATQIQAPRIWQQRLGKILTAFLITLGIVGCTISSQADVWWTKSVKRSGHYEAVAAIINESEKPLLLSDGKSIEMLALTRHLDPDLALQLVDKSQVPEIPDEFNDVFLLGPSLILKKRLMTEAGYRVKPLYRHADEVKLWEVKPRKQRKN
ncbi:MAG: glycosyltransferase family 39 protein [Cyanobacteria bacterium P01_F01_bin.86]